MHRLARTRGSRHVSVGPSIHSGERFRGLQVRVEGQHQRGAFLHEADPGMTMAVKAACMAFGLFAPAFQVEVILRHVRFLAPNKETGRKAGQHAPHVWPGRIVAVVDLRLQPLTRRLTWRTRAAVRIKGMMDGPSILYSVAKRLLRVRDRAQPSVDIAGQPPEVLVRRPPFCASRWRWRAACMSPKASAMRRPGGGRGPPGASLRIPRTAAPSSSPPFLATSSAWTDLSWVSYGWSEGFWRSSVRTVASPGGSEGCRALKTSRAMARHPRTVRRLFPWARLSASRTGFATSRRK